jgi:hypothetical protein
MLLRSWGLSHGPEETTQQPPAPLTAPAVRELPLIAGIPYEEVLAIVKRHRGELEKIPGVTDVSFDEEGMIVCIRDPAVQQQLPSAIEGLPVKAKVLPTLPPPAGVIVLRPNGVREQADACPHGFNEVRSFDWRFCIDPNNPQQIPPLMAPPVAGIPYEQALEILERHREELMKLPGVNGVGMGNEGIEVFTTNPAVVPPAIEGLPIKTRPPSGLGVGMNHTENTQSRPLHGGVAINGGLLRGTMTSIALSEGKPWMIFPTHLMPGTVPGPPSPMACNNPSPCPPAAQGQFSLLNACSHQPQPPSVHIFQPVTVSPGDLVGFTVRWDHLQSFVFGTTTDVAAAFMGNRSWGEQTSEPRWK